MHLLMHSEIMGDSYFVILFWGVWVGFFFPNSHILLTKPAEINEYNYDGMCTIASSREGKLYLSLYKEISSYCNYK